MVLRVTEIKGLEEFLDLKVVAFLAAVRCLKLGSALVLSFSVSCIRRRGEQPATGGEGNLLSLQQTLRNSGSS